MTTPQQAPAPSVRDLIAQLAASEDDLRECRRIGATERRDVVIRNQAHIVRELRRRRSTSR
jgi:hypothetical protein